MKALHFEQENSVLPPAVFEAVAEIPGLELEIVKDWSSLKQEELLARIQGCDILIASRAPYVPDELAEHPGKLKYICYVHGTMRKVIGLPIVRSGIQITNWGDQAGHALAQASLTLLLAVISDLHSRIVAVRGADGRHIISEGMFISHLNVGVYGFGFAARKFVKLLQPFGANIRILDPYVDKVPDYCHRVDSLEDLFSESQAVVIHAGLTPETEKSVSRELLAMLPDQGVIINTARGAIIDQTALFDELRAGRLRAGLDVLWPDDLSDDHQARQWENLIWTRHRFGGKAWQSEGVEGVLRAHKLTLDNLRAFVEGRTLDFVIDEARYARMT
jgi:phosphoglycerate dehydrogenase-like enzyme